MGTRITDQHVQAGSWGTIVGCQGLGVGTTLLPRSLLAVVNPTTNLVTPVACRPMKELGLLIYVYAKQKCVVTVVLQAKDSQHTPSIGDVVMQRGCAGLGNSSGV